MSLKGYNTKVGYYEETSFGTKPEGTDTSSITYSPPGYVSRIAMDIEPEILEIWALGSRDVAELLRGRKAVSVSIEYIPVDWVFARYGIDNIAKSVAIWVNLVDISKHLVLLGCKADSVSFEVAEGEEAKMTVELIGKSSDDAAPSYASIGSVSGTPITFKDVDIQKNGTSIKSNVKDFSLTIENNLEPIHVLASEEPIDILEKNREITGRIGLTFKDLTEYSEVVGDTEFTLAIVCGGKTITLSGCKWEKWSSEITPEDIIYLPLDFRAKSISIA